VRNEKARRAAVFGIERLAVEAVGDPGLAVGDVLERKIRRVAAVAEGDNVLGGALDVLEERDPELYGGMGLGELETRIYQWARELGCTARCFQTNHEGQLIDWIHEAGLECAAGRLIGAVLNPGALTHTSVALHDAIKGANLPVVEVHISNVHAREQFRRHSFVSPVARGIVVGFGVAGYPLAIRGLCTLMLSDPRISS